MKMSSLNFSRNYLSFNEPFTISAKFTLEGTETLKKWTDEDGDVWYNSINAELVLGHEFFYHKEFEYWGGGYYIEGATGWDSCVDYWIPIEFDPQKEGVPNEAGYVFSDCVNLGKGASATYTRTTAYIPGWTKRSIKKYLDERGVKWETDEKRSLPFRIIITHGGDFVNLISSKTNSGQSHLYEPEDGDLGVFIFERKVPEIENFSIIDAWSGRKVAENPMNITDLTPRLLKNGYDVKKYYFKEHPLFLAAKDYSQLKFSTEKINLDPLDPTLTLQESTVKIWSGELENLFNVSTDEIASSGVEKLEDYLNLQNTNFISKIIDTPEYVLSGVTNDSIIPITSTILSIPENEAKKFCYIYEITDSLGYSTYIMGEFIVEPYTLPKVSFKVERVSYNLDNNPVIDPEGIYAAANIDIKIASFKNNYEIKNEGKYYLTWENLDNEEDTSEGKGNFDKEISFSGNTFSIPLTATNDSINPEAVKFLSGEHPVIKIIEKDENGNIISEREETAIDQHEIVYDNANRYSIQLTVIDEFIHLTQSSELQENSAIFNIEVGGVSVGERHPTPLSENPSFRVNYPAYLLQPVYLLQSMILTEGINLGKELPKNGVHGQLFFKYTL